MRILPPVPGRSSRRGPDTNGNTWSGPHRLLSVMLSLALTSMGAFVMPTTAHALTLEDAGLASKRISAGTDHTLAIASDGRVLAWGDNHYDQCDVPAGLDDVVAVAAGQNHSLALRSDGTVEAWGGEGGTVLVPPDTNDAVAIAAGDNHSLVLSEEGTVIAAGSNNAGKCDVPSDLNGVIAVAAGDEHSLALKSDGTVVVWGSNAYGQCNVPVGLDDVVAVDAGGSHSLALRSDGTVVAWGRTSEQQCSVPSGLDDVVAVSAGLLHSLALKSDGTVVAWGGYMQDGNTDSSVFVPLTLTNATAVTAGGHHSVAVLPDGTLASWGVNRLGQAFGITSIVPAAWSTEVPVDAAFTVSFSSPISAGTTYGQVTLKDPSGNLVAIDTSISGKDLRIKPKASLKSDTRYTVLIPASGVKDAWGNSTIGTSFGFTTPDTLPPVITSANPADGTKGVAADQALAITFNERLVAGPALANVAVRSAQGSIIPCTVSIGGSDDRVLLVTPLTNFAWGSYSLTVPADALQDVRGNLFAGIVTHFEVNPPSTLTYIAGPNGFISGSSPQTVNYGQDGASVTAVPSAGYRFVGWSDGVTTATRTDTRVTSSRSVTANFTLNAFTLAFDAPSTSVYGSAKVSGSLRDASGAPISGKPVQIQYASGSWAHAATVYTDASGNFTKTLAPKAKTTYRAFFAGDATYLAQASTTRVVLPAVKLSRSTSWKTLKRNKAYSAKGYIYPAHKTSDSNKVKIRAYKKNSKGRYVYVKSFTASYVYSSTAKTGYKAKVTLKSKGAWMLQAYHAKDSNHYTSLGSADYVTVK